MPASPPPPRRRGAGKRSAEAAGAGRGRCPWRSWRTLGRRWLWRARPRAAPRYGAGGRGGVVGKVVRRERHSRCRRRRRSGDGQSFPSRALGGDSAEAAGLEGQRPGLGGDGARSPRAGRWGGQPARGGGGGECWRCRLAGPCAPLPLRGTDSRPGPAGSSPRRGSGRVSRDWAGSLPFRPPFPRVGVTCFCGGGRLGRFCSSAVSGYCHGEFPFPGRPRRLRKRGLGRGGGEQGPALTLPGALALPLLPLRRQRDRPRPGAAAPLSRQDGVVSAVSQAFGKPQGRFAWVKLCAWRR